MSRATFISAVICIVGAGFCFDAHLPAAAFGLGIAAIICLVGCVVLSEDHNP